MHGHVQVNANRVNIPSFRVKPGMEVRVAPDSREIVPVKLAKESAARGGPLSWVSVDLDKGAGRLLEYPTRDTIPVNAQEQLIVELYSK
jgi:small subunit ribosomal protein S4